MKSSRNTTTLLAFLVVVLLAASIPILSRTHSVYPTAHASTKTISLVVNAPGGYYYWNSTNPTVTVTQGDMITLDLSSTSGSHRFWLDLDNDGFSDLSDCGPTMDPCSSTISPTSSTMITFTASTVGTFMYTCTIHYPSMTGTFKVQAPATPDYTIASNPASLNLASGSTGTTTITITGLGGFSGSVALAGAVSPQWTDRFLQPIISDSLRWKHHLDDDCICRGGIL